MALSSGGLVGLGWPIIIGGCHRSGTSLVRRILNTHSRIYCGPEAAYFRDFYGQYVRDPIRHGRFMRAARAFLPEDELMEVLGRAFIEIHQRAAARAGKPRWADKDPLNVLHLDDWAVLLGNAWLFVHVVRNPLDTIASIKEIRFPFAIPADLGGRIAHYRTCMTAGLAFESEHTSRYYRLVYEDLVSAPEMEIRKLMTWLGEAFESSQLTFNDHVHGSGLEDPNVSKTRHVHHESVGRWKRVLTADEVHEIESSCSQLWELVR